MEEKNLKAQNGYLWIAIHLLLIITAILGPVIFHHPGITIASIILLIPTLPGYFIVNPNSSKVMTLFGKYVGTVKANGFFWANPFYLKKKVSLRARNLDGEKIKVNDKLGNPIIIGAVVVWKVDNTAKAAFEVDDYEYYVRVQSDAAIRNLSGKYPYDNFDDEMADITLRSGGDKVNSVLEEELAERLAMAGIKVIEARITHLAYAEEIAGAMLQRQQATAVVAARTKIVEGAVGMVEMALEQLEKDKIIDMDDSKKAAMVSNLMVVLCSDKAAAPVVNTGTLYH